MSASGIAKDHLKSFVERIERLEEEQKELANDKREVYAEAKLTGFDVKAIRTIVQLRKRNPDDLRQEEAVLQTYMIALGMLADTPLGQAAIKAVKKTNTMRVLEAGEAHLRARQ